MTTSIQPSVVAAPRGFRRVAPAFVLFFLSPFVAEFLLGNISISAIGSLLIVAPLYGGGAVAVRELARRFGLGWRGIVLLALAYGLLEEGVVIMTLFNPNYLGLHLLQQAYVPALGIGGWWTLFVLTLHTIWSISVPIAVTEALFAERRTTPWLGKLGLGVALLLLIAGGAVIRFATTREDPFMASSVQLLSTTVLIVLVALLALRWRRPAAVGSGTPPPAIGVGAVTLGLGLAFMSAHYALQDWTLVAAYLVLYGIALAVLVSWSRRTGWTPLHTLGAAGGAMLAYAVSAFPQDPVIGAKGTIDLCGNALFAAIAVVVLALAFRNARRAAATAA